MADIFTSLPVLAFLHRPTLQLPFAVAMQGAALMVAAALLWTARGQLSPGLGRAAPWGWLGGFAGLRTAAVVGPVMLGQVTPGLALDGFRAAYFFAAAAGWMCVLEFGRRLGGWRSGVWVWPGLGAVVAGLAGGWSAWAWWLGWGLALPASILAAWGLAGGRAAGLSPAVGRVLAGGLVALALLELTGLRSVELYQGYSVYRIGEIQVLAGFVPARWAELKPIVPTGDSVALVDRLLALWGALAAAAWAGVWWWSCYRDVAVRGRRDGVARRLLWMLPLAMLLLVGGGFQLVRWTIRATTNAHAERRFEQMAAIAAAADEHLGAAKTLDGFGRWVKERGLTGGFGRVFMWRADEGVARVVRWSEVEAEGLPGVPPRRGLTEFERAMEGLRLPYMLRPHREAGELVATWNHPLATTLEGGGWWLGVRQDGVAYFSTMVLPRAYAVVLVFMFGLTGMMFYWFYIRREAELALRIDRERAEASDRAKTELLARVSHELRTPLQGVLGYAELLDRGRLTPEAGRYLEAMRGQGALLLRLVNDLLDYGALQAGVMSMRAEVFRPTDAAESAWAAVLPLAARKRLECRSRLEGLAGRRVRGDELRVRQVLVNLLGNAVKFTPEGGVVGLDGWVAKGKVGFRVTDSGPGVAAADEGRIFEPMERGRDEGEEGAGLGLALARSLCRAMGGELRLVRGGAKGAEFVAEFALSEVETAARGEVAASDPEPARMPASVLVAEDNGLIRQLLEAQLGELGCEVETVGDGEQAVAAWRARRAEAVILDLAMPRMGGAEAARRIRALSAEEGRPWLVGLSAHATDEDRERGMRAGMNRFLVKPTGLAELAAALAGGGARTGSPVPGERGARAGMEAALREVFRAETPGLLAALEGAIERGEGEVMRAKAHYLKSTALVLGERELAELCRRCETEAEAGRDEQAARWARDLVAEARRLLAAGEAR